MRRKQEEEARCKREVEEAVRRAENRLLWKLGHVDDYLQELGESRIEFEDLFDRLKADEEIRVSERCSCGLRWQGGARSGVAGLG